MLLNIKVCIYISLYLDIVQLLLTLMRSTGKYGSVVAMFQFRAF